MKTLFSYCLLSLIQEKKMNLTSLTEVFVEFTEAILSIEGWKGYFLIKDLRELYSRYGLNAPYSILQTILIDVKKKNPDYIVLNVSDFSFEITPGTYRYLSIDGSQVEREVAEVEDLYSALCKQRGVPSDQTLQYFIDLNKAELVSFVTRGAIQDIRNSEQFSVFQLLCLNDRHRKIIERMLSGSTISCYLELEIQKGFDNKKLILDTNFLVSLSNLHSEESYQNATDLIQFGKRFGYEFYALPQTLKEYKNLIQRVSDLNRGVTVFTALNKNTIEYGCQRRKLTWQSLLNYKTQIDVILRKMDVFVVDQATNSRLYRESFGSPIFELIKDRPFNREGVTHDVMAINYVKSFWSGTEASFSDIPSFFVTDTHGYLENKVNQTSQLPYIIRTNELLNILWLTHPQGDRSTAKQQLQRLSTAYFEKTIPRKDDLRRLDARLNLAKDFIVTPKDCVDIANNIALLDSEKLKPLFEAETADVVATQITSLAETARSLRLQQEKDESIAVVEMIKEIEQRTDKIVEFTKSEAEQNVKAATYQQLVQRKKYLREMIDRDSELLSEKRVRLDTLASGIDRFFAGVSIAVAVGIAGAAVPTYWFLVLPNWSTLDPLLGTASVFWPLVYFVLSSSLKQFNPVHWFDRLATTRKGNSKQILDLTAQTETIEKRMAEMEREWRDLIV